MPVMLPETSLVEGWASCWQMVKACTGPPAISAAPDKGLHRIKLIAQTQTGEKLTLYEQSHAL